MAFPPYGSTVPALNNWQWSYNGLAGGAGTAYPISLLTGLGDVPSVATGDMARPRSHGELRGLNFTRGRDVIMDLWVAAQPGASVQYLLEALASSVVPSAVPDEYPLWIQLPNLPTLCSMARVHKRTVPYDFNYSASQVAKPVISWHSTDPRLYAPPQQETCGLGTPLGGMTFPATFPLTFGGGTVAGIINATNAGNVDMNPVLVITGPCTNPTVTNATTGWSLSFSNPYSSGYTLNAGDTLTVDTDLQTITYVAYGTTVGSAQSNWLVAGSTWPNPVNPIYGLAAGLNVVQFTSSDATTVAGTLSVQFSSAYLL